MKIGISQACINTLQLKIGGERQVVFECASNASKYIDEHNMDAAKPFVDLMNTAQENVNTMEGLLKDEIDGFNKIAKEIT